MSQSRAILAGAVLIALSIVAVNNIKPALALNSGPYQLMHHSNAAANAGVFRLDVNTGEVSYCFIAGNNSPDIVCTRATR